MKVKKLGSATVLIEVNNKKILCDKFFFSINFCKKFLCSPSPIINNLLFFLRFKTWSKHCMSNLKFFVW